MCAQFSFITGARKHVVVPRCLTDRASVTDVNKQRPIAPDEITGLVPGAKIHTHKHTKPRSSSRAEKTKSTLLTLDILSGWLRSAPPCMRKPHGEPPSKTTSRVVMVRTDSVAGQLDAGQLDYMQRPRSGS